MAVFFGRMIKKILLILVTISVIVMLSPFCVFAEEDRWEFVGKTDNDIFLLYIDNQSISYMPEDIVRFRVRRELSPEGVKLFRKSFDESVKIAEESGVKAEDLEDLFKASVKAQTKEHTCDIYCEKNEIWIHPPVASIINFIISNPILPGTAEERIKNKLCKSKPR
jgi:uncharacterized UBP type Zn finger protein